VQFYSHICLALALAASPVAPYADGVRLVAEEQYRAAIAKFEEALAVEPDHDPSLYEAAGALAATGNLEKALEYSTRALELDPENRWYKGRQARLVLAAERYDEALPLYRDMTAPGNRFDPDNWRMLSLLYYQSGEKESAMAMLDSIETHMGRTPELLDLKRSILIEEEKMDEAVAETEKYLAGAPYDEENRLVLAEMYTIQGRDSLARAVLAEVLEINPGNATAQKLLAPAAEEEESVDRLLARGDLEGALVLMKRDLPRPADDPADFASLGTYLDITSLEGYLGRPDSVMVWSRRGLEVYPHVVALHTMTATAQHIKGQTAAAQKTLSKALKMTPSKMQQSGVWGTKGDLWHETGDRKKTFAAYDKALQLNPDNVLVLNNYAYFMAIGGGNLDRALEMTVKANALEPNNATYLDTHAWVLYLRGDYAEAKRIMGQALPLDRENNPELLLHYGDILWALGEDFMATRYWKRALEAGYERAGEIEERLSRKR
jgi:tetratricopeptide (TPR) repeat protein